MPLFSSSVVRINTIKKYQRVYGFSICKLATIIAKPNFFNISESWHPYLNMGYAPYLLRPSMRIVAYGRGNISLPIVSDWSEQIKVFDTCDDQSAKDHERMERPDEGSTDYNLTTNSRPPNRDAIRKNKHNTREL